MRGEELAGQRELVGRRRSGPARSAGRPRCRTARGRAGPGGCAASTDGSARRAPPAKMMCEASRWNRCASSPDRSWCRCSTWLWAQASSKARVAAPASRNWSARARASSRDSAKAVVNATTADPPGSSRSRRRRLKIGSSTGPTVPERTAPGSSAAGFGERPPAAEEPRPVGLVLDLADRLAAAVRRAVHRRDVHGPERLLGGRSHPAPAEDRLGPGSHSVSRNSLPNAGWPRSAPRGASTTSA